MPLRAAGCEQPLRDLRGDLGYLHGLFVVLSDEGINIALRIGDFHERQADGADAGALGYLVGVDRTARSKANDAPLLFSRLLNRLIR